MILPALITFMTMECKILVLSHKPIAKTRTSLCMPVVSPKSPLLACTQRLKSDGGFGQQ